MRCVALAKKGESRYIVYDLLISRCHMFIITDKKRVGRSARCIVFGVGFEEGVERDSQNGLIRTCP